MTQEAIQTSNFLEYVMAEIINISLYILIILVVLLDAIGLRKIVKGESKDEK